MNTITKSIFSRSLMAVNTEFAIKDPELETFKASLVFSNQNFNAVLLQ